jgi:uncharacterized protein
MLCPSGNDGGIKKKSAFRGMTMHYLIMAYDATDEDALKRRLAAREEHLASIGKMKAEGKSLYGAALLDDSGNMIGSMLVVNFPTEDTLRQYLASEPYITGHVWAQVEVKPCRVPEIFQK